MIRLLALLLSTAALHAAEKPNVLLIVADDLGWSDVGWHGGFGKTPHMDQLVRSGVELDAHYVQPVCTPTRTALMSGRYPGRFWHPCLCVRELAGEALRVTNTPHRTTREG